MVVAVVSVLGVYAQGTAQFPEATMQSTSTMVGTGSSLPQAAVSGTTLAGETPGAYSPGRAGHIRKVGEDEGWEDEPDPETPANPFPLGDVFWPLALCALAYLIVRVARRRMTKG